MSLAFTIPDSYMPFIIGINKAPIEDTSAIAEPEIPPKNRLEGLSNQEIADSLSISINTVRTQKQRAMAVLKKRFSMGILLVLLGMVDLFN